MHSVAMDIVLKINWGFFVLTKLLSNSTLRH